MFPLIVTNGHGFYSSSIVHRPEKNHPAQLRALRSLLQAHPEYRIGPDAVTLVLLGSVRNKEDMDRVEALKELAFELNIHVRLVCRTLNSFPDIAF